MAIWIISLIVAVGGTWIILRDDKFCHTLKLIFTPEIFVEQAASIDAEREYNTNREMRESHPEGMPGTYKQEFKEGAKSRTSKIRTALYQSFLVVFWSIFVALAFAYPVSRFVSARALDDLWKIAVVVSAFLISWAVLGKLGWSIQTFDGKTLPEQINDYWFRMLTVAGVTAGFFSLFLQFLSKQK